MSVYRMNSLLVGWCSGGLFGLAMVDLGFAWYLAAPSSFLLAYLLTKHWHKYWFSSVDPQEKKA